MSVTRSWPNCPCRPPADPPYPALPEASRRAVRPATRHINRRDCPYRPPGEYGGKPRWAFGDLRSQRPDNVPFRRFRAADRRRLVTPATSAPAREAFPNCPPPRDNERPGETGRSRVTPATSAPAREAFPNWPPPRDNERPGETGRRPTQVWATRCGARCGVNRQAEWLANDPPPATTRDHLNRLL